MLRAPLCVLLVPTLAALLSSCGYHSYWSFENEAASDYTLRANTSARVTFTQSFNSGSGQTATLQVTSRAGSHVVIERADIVLRNVDERDKPIDSVVYTPEQRWERAGPQLELLRASNGSEIAGTGKPLATLEGDLDLFQVEFKFHPSDVRDAKRLRVSVYLRMSVNDALVEVRRDIYLKKEAHSYFWFGRDC